MSIIEKALEKLEQTEVRGGTASAFGSGPALRKVRTDGAAVIADREFAEDSERQPTRPSIAKTSRRVELDLITLRRAGMLTPESMDTPRAEQYRRIKRPILVKAFEGKPGKNSNLLLVTSSVSGEGKSYTSLNLAMSVASELDRTVLLVDSDVIRQSLTKQLKLSNEPGLTDFLKTEGADLADYLLRTSIPNFVFLPAGRVDHQVAELWSTERMHRLMDELAKRYSDRLVIFDSPPVLEQASTAVLGSLVGQVLMVIEAEKTAQHVVREALQALGAHARVGLVLNKSNQRFSSEYGYGYYTQ